MTPGARVAAAADLLDRILAGTPADPVLTRWARQSRFAGSGDRNAIRDLVFDAFRCRRSFAALGGSETGRGLMIGALRAAGKNPAEFFTGEGYAPASLTVAEAGPPPDLSIAPEGVRCDLPDWLLPELSRSLGDELPAVADLLRSRAPVGLRVNALRADHASAEAALLKDGIESAPHPLARWARVATVNARRVRMSDAYRRGLVELQDPASQALVEALLPIDPGTRVLDYCAGGGGKSLALAAATRTKIFAHDINPGRMADIGPRAERAGAQVTCLSSAQVLQNAPWELVLADAPCSGSGAWRRQPESKWTLTADHLNALRSQQADVLGATGGIVARGGRLAYATCSLLRSENEDQISAFLARAPGRWRLLDQCVFRLRDGGDGFFLAQLLRE